MKDSFTIREVMDGTGLTRQRIHQLIKNRAVPVVRTNKWFLLKWQDLMKLADNASILNFLKDTLDNERKLLEKAYEDMKENEKAIQYVKAIDCARILVEGHPEINSQDSERWNQWNKASLFFDNLTTIKNPAMGEQNKEGKEPLADD